MIETAVNSNLLDLESTIPVGLKNRELVYERVSIRDLLHRVLYAHIDRLVKDPRVQDLTKQATEQFVMNLVQYFNSKNWTETMLGAFLIAMNFAAAGRFDETGDWVPFSTFVRTHNPLEDNAGTMFTVGRARTADVRLRTTADLNDPNMSEEDRAWRMAVSDYWTRTQCGEIALPFDDFCDLLPRDLLIDELVEIAFIKALFSDGAWQLYCKCLGRDVPIWEEV